MTTVAPRIVIVGGGSNQWVPKLVTDFANSRSLADAHVVLEDIRADNLPRMRQFVERCARIRGIGMTCETTTDQRAALDGADFVVVSISTGGFDSMRFDLDVPARYGCVQTVGDTVGPGGISRGLRNIPVLVGIGRDMEELCPDAWLLNLTNPMTTLTRAITRETSVRCVGLCHEVPITSFFVSMLLDVDPRVVRPTVAGVNHLPVVTALDLDGRDGLSALAALAAGRYRGDLDEPLPFDLPDDLLGVPSRAGTGRWTKGDLLDSMRVKLALLDEHGVLPAAGDRHLVEFLPELFDGEADLLERWGVRTTSIEERMTHERQFSHAVDAALASDELAHMPSGELVTPVINSLLGGRARDIVVNIPNVGQVADVRTDAVVECVATIDSSGVHARDIATLPQAMAERIRSIVESQELVVEAALSGDRGLVHAAMAADPMTSRLSPETRTAMTDELLAATAPWLPAFGD